MAAAAGVVHLIVAAAATLLAAVFLAAVLDRRRRLRRAPAVEWSPTPEVDCGVADGGGNAAVDGLTDVIVVGAGVAGSALAYTLGKVRYLKIIEKSGYQALPWVRYITMAGEYEPRLSSLWSGC